LRSGARAIGHDRLVLDLRRLHYFLAVARKRSFSRAAEALHVAQPAVSRQVGLLERELGVALLERTPQGVEPTAAGRHLLEHGAALERDAEALWERMRAFAAGARGQVRLGYSASSSYETAPRLIGALRARLLDVHVSSIVLPSVELPEAVMRGPLDAALVRCPPATAGLQALAVRRERLGVLMREDHPLAGDGTVDLGALRDERFVLHGREANPRHYDLIVGACRAAGFEPRIVPAAAPFDPTYGAILDGEAVALVGESARTGVPAGLAWRRLTQAPVVDIALLVRAGTPDPVMLRVAEAVPAIARAEHWL
jgi:LysR family transcriptional regulator, benzoate and cis,cis-muconate-responsive activator of ben and cat genes